MASILVPELEPLVRRGRMQAEALAAHPDKDEIEALYDEMFPGPDTYGRVAIIMTLTETRLVADLQMLRAFKGFIGRFRLEEVRNAVRALRRAGHADNSEALTAEGIQALIDLGIGHDADEALTVQMEYSHLRGLQELVVTRSQDAALIREALDRKIFDPEQVRSFVDGARGAAPAVADGAL